MPFEKGQKNPRYGTHRSGKENPMYGKHHSEETRLKMSIARTGKCMGDSNPAKQPEVRRKISEAGRGRPQTEEHRKNNSESHIGLCLGEKSARFGKRAAEDTIKKISENHADVSGAKNPNYGKHCSDETRKRMSDGRKGKLCLDKNPNWCGGISFWPYCEKFDEACKERVRDEFNRTCLMCGCSESENLTTTGKQRKLSVHHVRYDKQEGCNGNDFFLVPLCLKCHPKTSAGDRAYWEHELTAKRDKYLASCGQ